MLLTSTPDATALRSLARFEELHIMSGIDGRFLGVVTNPSIEGDELHGEVKFHAKVPELFELETVLRIRKGTFANTHDTYNRNVEIVKVLLF